MLPGICLRAISVQCMSIEGILWSSGAERDIHKILTE